MKSIKDALYYIIFDRARDARPFITVKLGVHELAEGWPYLYRVVWDRLDRGPEND